MKELYLPNQIDTEPHWECCDICGETSPASDLIKCHSVEDDCPYNCCNLCF